MPETYEIRLIITHGESGYSAKWIDSGGQESDPFPLTLPLTKDEAEQLRWYLEEYHQFPGAGDHVKAQSIESKLKEWGQALFKAAFGTAEGTNIYRNLMDAIQQGKQGLITLGATDPNVLVQPWEMMRDTKGVLALRGVTLRRQLQGAKPGAHFSFALPLRILLIVSRPTDVSFIDPRNSLPPVLDACDQLGGQVEVEFCDPPTLARLEEMISERRKARRPYHIVHFDGHGTYLPLTGVGALVFENEDAKTDLVTGTRFGDLMARQDVPLVLLEACRGADLSDRPVFGSLAPALLDSGVGSVVAFSHSVHIRAARIFVERFYKELVAHQSVGSAVQEARAAMLAKPDRFLHLGPQAESINLEDWFIPQLYQVGADPILIPIDSAVAPARSISSSVALDGFPPEPMYKFHGRALELLEIERAFRKHNAVVVSGMGGMGKTALAREAAAWWLRTGRFDRAVFISFEQKAGATNAIQMIGKALEGDNFSSRLDDDTKEGQWKTAVRLFHEHRLLVVWDNFESTLPIYQNEDEKSEGEITVFTDEARARLRILYQDLTAGKPKGRLLVTCRPQETGLSGIKEYALEGLKRPDSLHLLAAALDVKGIKTEREGYERHEMEELLDLLADHPLSVELIAPHLKELTPTQIRSDFGVLLEKFANPDAPEDRNKGLRASLEFSRRRLSKPAQEMLPWLAWFEGGVFELFLLDFADKKPDAWNPIRTELEATALLKVERLEQFNAPYLRFHPTLSYAARPHDVPDPASAEKRFIGVYLAVMKLADELLGGQQPAAGMALMAREEANFRHAVQAAFARDLRGEMHLLADTLRHYLERAGRNRERDALTTWARAHLPDDVLDPAACNAILDDAWTLLTQGNALEAVNVVQALLARLKSEGLAEGFDLAWQIAVTYLFLGRVFLASNRPDLSLEPLKEAIARFENLPGDTGRGNRSVALGDLANAYLDLGNFDSALKFAEQRLVMERELKRTREIAASLGVIAQILARIHRYAEAEQRYFEAMQAARAAEDLELQGILLQHQAFLQSEQGNLPHAVELFKQAIALFQRSSALSDEMRTCDLLASAERHRGELDAAEAWYERARQLAEHLNDWTQLAATAQNLGVLYQTRAETASTEAARQAWLAKAVASVQESLEIKVRNQNQVGAATSYFQLGVLHQILGDLQSAEEFLLKSVTISEALDLPEVYKDYANLAKIARARGDEKSAAEWQAKAQAKYTDIKRRERGEGTATPRVDDQFLKALTRLAQVCYAVRAQKAAIPLDVAEALAQLHDAPAPLNEIGAFLQAAASGQALLPVPSGLPKQIQLLLEGLKEAIEEAEKG